MLEIAKTVGLIVAVLAAFVVLTLISGAVVMLLWNWLMPYLFGLPELDIWKSIGLLALLNVLFGIFRVKVLGRLDSE